MKAQLLTLFSIALITGSCTKEVQPRPVANFSYSVRQVSTTEVAVSFVNTSKNADRYQWLTSGGIARDTRDIDISYVDNGRYRVSLTAKNDAGEDTKTESIDISSIATTGNFVFFTSVPDKGDISISVNNSVQGRINKYYSSGSPACGEQGSVTVTLAPGTHSYSAKSEGLFPLYWSGTFIVVRGECRSLRLTK